MNELTLLLQIPVFMVCTGTNLHLSSEYVQKAVVCICT